MNETEFIGKKIVFGTYFLGEYTEATGKPFQEAIQDLERNPFKYIPLFLQVAINSTAEIDGRNTDKVELKEVLQEIDKIGVASDEVQGILECFTRSLQTKEDTKKKPAKNKVRPVKK